MEKQIIVSVSRESGSGGHDIARIISDRLNLPLFDKNLLEEVCKEKNIDYANMKDFDEKPRRRFVSKSIFGYTNSAENIINEMQFEFIKNKAESGESFVVVGRCSDEILRGNPSLVSIFVLGDIMVRAERVSKKYGVLLSSAKEIIQKSDKEKKYFHNYYSDNKWGDSRTYDICINSSRLGINETAEYIIEYINRFINRNTGKPGTDSE